MNLGIFILVNSDLINAWLAILKHHFSGNWESEKVSVVISIILLQHISNGLAHYPME
jgi:hypothetical protein